ncbi:hypothetical protein, partial [Serratia marcescens]|uniref:hypothetical protein n=3 Tax=Pseudomonadota TaxID=1224 RepID=UPI0027E57459
MKNTKVTLKSFTVGMERLSLMLALIFEGYVFAPFILGLKGLDANGYLLAPFFGMVILFGTVWSFQVLLWVIYGFCNERFVFKFNILR